MFPLYQQINEKCIYFVIFFRGRLRHGRHFTFRSSNSDIAITLVSGSVTGSIATREHPYSACGNWLQVGLYTEIICENFIGFELKLVE